MRYEAQGNTAAETIPESATIEATQLLLALQLITLALVENLLDAHIVSILALLHQGNEVSIILSNALHIHFDVLLSERTAREVGFDKRLKSFGTTLAETSVILIRAFRRSGAAQEELTELIAFTLKEWKQLAIGAEEIGIGIDFGSIDLKADTDSQSVEERVGHHRSLFDIVI